MVSTHSFSTCVSSSDRLFIASLKSTIPWWWEMLWTWKITEKKIFVGHFCSAEIWNCLLTWYFLDMFELGPKKYNSYFSRSRIIKIKLTSVKRQQHLHWIQIFTAVDHELCIHTIENQHRTVERERFLLFRYFAFIHYERFDNLIIISSYTCCQWNTQ